MKTHAARVRCGTLCGIVGMILNCLLFASKLTAGLLNGSISLVADAVNTLTDASSSLKNAHALADRLERKIEERFGLQTVIHIDPIDLTNPLLRTLRSDLSCFLSALDPQIRFHDLQAVSEPDGTIYVSFDLNLPFGCTLTDETVQRTVSAHLTCIDPAIRPIIRVDHYDPDLMGAMVS